MTEKALMVSSVRHGPFVEVKKLRQISFTGLNGDDELHVMHGSEILCRAIDNGVHPVNLAEGELRVLRISGTSRVTVRALEED